MFGFIGSFKKEVQQAFVDLHARLITLENKVETLFGDKAATLTDVIEHPVKDVAHVASEATEAVADKVEAVAENAEQDQTAS